MKEGNAMTRILAIDDEKDILMLIKNALAKEGYDVTLLSDPLKIGELNLNAYQLKMCIRDRSCSIRKRTENNNQSKKHLPLKIQK